MTLQDHIQAVEPEEAEGIGSNLGVKIVALGKMIDELEDRIIKLESN